MNPEVAAAVDDLKANEIERHNRAFTVLLEATKVPVTWAYDIWDVLLGLLKTGDNRQRSIASQILCRLAQSDPKERALKDFDAILNVTRDERFVTARHCLQNLWRIGIAGPKHKQKYIRGMEQRFTECAVEKNCTLIRYDILESLRKVYDAAPDEKLRQIALVLIENETDAKYKKKYMTLWRK